MNRGTLAGIVAVSLIVSALLLGYIYLTRTSSGYRMQQFQSTISFFEDRIEALERQRDLLRDSAASLEDQAAALNKRVEQVDIEIQNMRTRLVSERKEAKTPF